MNTEIVHITVGLHMPRACSHVYITYLDTGSESSLVIEAKSASRQIKTTAVLHVIYRT